MRVKHVASQNFMCETHERNMLVTFTALQNPALQLEEVRCSIGGEGWGGVGGRGTFLLAKVVLILFHKNGSNIV